jgi:hypothetical protein
MELQSLKIELPANAQIILAQSLHSTSLGTAIIITGYYYRRKLFKFSKGL